MDNLINFMINNWLSLNHMGIIQFSEKFTSFYLIFLFAATQDDNKFVSTKIVLSGLVFYLTLGARVLRAVFDRVGIHTHEL